MFLYEDFDFVVALGIQAYIREYLQVPFTYADLAEAKEIYAAHGDTGITN